MCNDTHVSEPKLHFLTIFVVLTLSNNLDEEYIETFILYALTVYGRILKFFKQAGER